MIEKQKKKKNHPNKSQTSRVINVNTLFLSYPLPPLSILRRFKNEIHFIKMNEREYILLIIQTVVGPNGLLLPLSYFLL